MFHQDKTYLQYFSLTVSYSITSPDFHKVFCKGWTLKKIILEGRGFRGGSDENMRRMWLGLDIFVVAQETFLPTLCDDGEIGG